MTNGLVLRAEQVLQFPDRLEVLGQKVWPHGDEKFLVSAQDDEIQNADIWRNCGGRASDIFNGNEGQAGFLQHCFELFQNEMAWFAAFGVELQYEYPDWTIERYNDRMGEIRRYFDTKFGTGTLVSRARDNDSDVIQTLVGYKWNVGTTTLELFYFSAERGHDLYRTISVSYKAL